MHIQRIIPNVGGGFNAAIFDSGGRVIHAGIEARMTDADTWLQTTSQLMKLHPALHAPDARARYALAGDDERNTLN